MSANLELFRNIMEGVGIALDGVGVLAVVIGAVAAIARFSTHWRREGEAAWKLFRQHLGRAILLGLEFLVAGDIIRTVVVAPTLENVSVLGLIVLIRTFLSFALQLELEGRWPWQRAVAKNGCQHGPNSTAPAGGTCLP